MAYPHNRSLGFLGSGFGLRRLRASGFGLQLEALGECIKRRCGGPRAESFDSGCDRAKEPPFGVTWLVKNFPQKAGLGDEPSGTPPGRGRGFCEKFGFSLGSWA